MRTAVVLAAIIGAALAAPTEDVSSLEELQRAKKSAGYGVPCAGAAPLAPVALYLTQASAPGLPHYREDEQQPENTEHARSFYDSAPASSVGAAAGAAYAGAGAGAGAASLAGGSAVGLFPNANIGNCGVPLLLSCAPNVVRGYIHHGAQPAYRSHENERHMREAAMEKSWSESERAAGHSQASEMQHIPHHHHVLPVELHQANPAQDVHQQH